MTNYEERPQNISKNAIQFAQACVDYCSIEDLETIDLMLVDVIDCCSWNISDDEWKWAICAALHAMKNNSGIMDDGRVVV